MSSWTGLPINVQVKKQALEINPQKVLFMAIFYVSSVVSSKFPLKDILYLSQDVKLAEENYLCSIDIRNRYKNEKSCECTKAV